MTEYEELPARFKKALLTKTKSNSPFWQLLDMDLVEVKKVMPKPKSRILINFSMPMEWSTAVLFFQPQIRPLA